MPESEDNSIDIWLKNFSGMFRFGRGLLGRSSIALVALVALGIAAIWKLHSDVYILAVFVIMAALFLIWYFRAERFAYKHPLEALLEGGEYTAHHQMLISAKNFKPNQIDTIPVVNPIEALARSKEHVDGV